MADNEDFEADDPLAGGSFSQLLFAGDDVLGLGLETDGCLNYRSSFPGLDPPKMICFGDYGKESESWLIEQTRTAAQKSGVTCSDSSSASSSNNCNADVKDHSLSKSNKKRNVGGNKSIQNLSIETGVPEGNQKNCKKKNSDNPASAGHAKGKRKEKLGERIAALQRLVSPFGKTDTASVLHEAMGYIKFLHDQIQVLCSPYLQRLPSSAHHPDWGENGEEEARIDLKKRGLCLVPVECTANMASSNGADFWSPSLRNIDSSGR